MQIKTYTFNEFRENMYVVYDDSLECILIDAGCSTSREEERLDAFIKEQKLKPVALVNTHGHVDHVIGNAYICEHYKVDSYLHPEDFILLDNVVAQGALFGMKVAQPPKPKSLGSTITFGNSSFEVLHVPGHSKGSIALYSQVQGVVFSGDTLFQDSIGRTDLPGGDYDEIMNSLRNVLMNLPNDTIVLPGHGYETTIGEEKMQNPFINSFL